MNNYLHLYTKRDDFLRLFSHKIDESIDKLVKHGQKINVKVGGKTLPIIKRFTRKEARKHIKKNAWKWVKKYVGHLPTVPSKQGEDVPSNAQI